ASGTGSQSAQSEAATTRGGAREPDRSATTERSAVPARARRSPEPPVGHWVQSGLFRDAGNARRPPKSGRSHGFSVQIASVTRNRGDATAGATYHVVRAGAFLDQAQAAKARDDLKMRGFSGFLVNESVRSEGR